MQAIHLSRKLVEGEACPVCGSLDHPNPAKGQAESKGLNDAFEDARKQKNEIKIKYDEEMGELAHQKARLEASKDFLAEAKTPPLSSAEIKIKISQLDFEENVEYEQLNIEQLKEERDKNEESKNQIKGSLNELIGDIPKELQNIEIVDLKIKNLNTEIEKLQ